MTDKFTIPGGYNFGQPHGQVAAFFAWLAHSQVNPEMINPAKPVVITRNDDALWALTASTLDGGTGTWPLGLPTTPVIAWLVEEFGVKATALDDVRPKLDKLHEARRRAAEAKEEAEELRAEILGVLTARKATVGTVNGVPFIAAKKIPQAGKFRRKEFEAAYPGLAAQYTDPDTEQTRLEFL